MRTARAGGRGKLRVCTGKARGYAQRVEHWWWGVWPLDLRRVLHLVPRNVEFSVVGGRLGLVARRALCGRKLVAVAGEFIRHDEVEPHRQCARCVAATAK